MLRITVRDNSETFRIQVEGKLTSPWVTELEDCWRGAPPGRSVVVDLSQVDYSDLAGRYLLALMRVHGVQFAAPSLPMQSILGEIEQYGAVIRGLLIVVLLAIGAAPVRAAEPLRLTLRRAVEIATSPEGSARLQISDELVRQAESRKAQARGALLPDVDAYVLDQNQTRNLRAVGIQFNSPIPGFDIPTFVGPFTTFDVRANLRQTVFDFSSIRRYQASRTAVDSFKSERSNTADQVAAQVVRAYLSALKSAADVESAEANVGLAKALLELVENQKAAGTGTGIEITRARVQLANEEQRMLVARNDRRRAELQLLRAIGLRLDTHVELDGRLAYEPPEVTSVEQARERALQHRDDLIAQRHREESAKLTSSATAFERLPSVTGFADYGSIGTGIDEALPTRTYGISLRIPIFDGGRRDARRAESHSQYVQERVRTRDMLEQVEMEIRVALDAIASADEQVKVAAEGLKLADNELAQARRRYAAGVSTSVEVTDAQTRLERARDNHVTALFAYNLARIDLAVAQGTVEDVIR